MRFRFRLIEDAKMSNEYDSEGNQLTKEQAEFFKNSKIRDSKGRLLVCRHSTESEFDEFQYKYLSEGKLGYGFYFILDEQRRERERQLYKINWSPKYRKACYLNVTNPTYDENVDDIIRAQWDFEEQNGSASQKEIIDFTSHKFNCDGIISYDRNSVVCFYPNQIKSITNKKPTNSNNINEGETLIKEDAFELTPNQTKYFNQFKYVKYPVYHRGSVIDEFDTDFIWFSSDAEQAKGSDDTRLIECIIGYNNPLEINCHYYDYDEIPLNTWQLKKLGLYKEEYGNKFDYVIPDEDYYGYGDDEYDDEGIEMYQMYSDDIVKIGESLGYDCVILKNINELQVHGSATFADDYVVFSNKQIKSITNKNPTGSSRINEENEG